MQKLWNGTGKESSGGREVAEVAGALLLWWKSGGRLAYILDINVFRIRASIATSAVWWGWNWSPLFIASLDLRPLYQPLFRKREIPLPQGILESTGPSSPTKLRNWQPGKADQIGNGVRSFYNWSDWWWQAGHMPLCLWPQDFLGGCLDSDRGEGFDSSWKK